MLNHSLQKTVAAARTLAVASAFLAIPLCLALGQQSQSPLPIAPPAGPPQSNGQPERFDVLVRNDFFAGMAGDRARFDRAMKYCEAVLAKNPKHSEALVWHGGGLLWLSSQVAEEDEKKAAEVWQKGLDEMDAAIAYDPQNMGVHIGRGATLLGFSQMVPDPARARPLVQRAVGDYEFALKLQEPFFHELPLHSRGELLFGLAEGWNRLGDQTKSRAYFQRIVTELPDTAYAALAAPWLDPQASPMSRKNMACIGCHAH